MILYYHNELKGNFGDDLNSWIWDKLIPGDWHSSDGVVMLGIGTILRRNIPKARKYVVFSSGAGYGTLPRGFAGPNWLILNVRGPLTAEVLGLPSDKAATDGAALLNLLPEYAPLPESERQGTVFMPHHNTLAGHWLEACALAGIDFIDPRLESRRTVERLRRAKLVLAEAMHAAVVADALRVPWIPIVTSPEINSFKWLDWTQSLALPYEPSVLPASSLREILCSATLALQGRKFALPDPTIEAALMDFYRQSDRKKALLWRGVFNLNRAAYVWGLKPCSKLLQNQVLQKEKLRLEAASTALRLATRRGAYLSHDSALQRRIEQLCDGLEKLQNLRQCG